VTANAAVLGFTPDKLSVIDPDTVTDTILPFGGHKVDGFAATFTTGGVTSIPNDDDASAPIFPALSMARSPTV
jgi:hypothetical protein